MAGVNLWILSSLLVFPGFQGLLGKQGAITNGSFKCLRVRKFVPKVELQGM